MVDKKLKQKEGAKYTAKAITVLSGLEPVLKRPAMYIGDTGFRGFHHLLHECLDNATDEALAGFCDEIELVIYEDNLASVSDNGRGIPTDMHPQTKKSALETVMTTLHAGGKFGKGIYKVSGGLHGVGVSVVCALSSWMRVEVYRDGKIYTQEYSNGKPKTKVEIIGKTQKTGTKVIFRPDERIFKTSQSLTKFDLKTILEHCRQQAYLTKKTKYKVVDKRQDLEHSFYFEGGITSYIRHLNKNKNVLNETPIYIEKQIDDTLVEIAIQYTDNFIERVFTFANNIHTEEGGTHLTGFKGALTRTINDYAKKQNLIKSGQDNLTGDDVREGLTAIISVKLSEPQFEGQTKARLGNPEVKTYTEQVVYEGLSRYFEENPTPARRTVEKCLLSASARLAARVARETVLKKGLLEGMTLPGKLADCSERDPKKSELFIVEGESAGGCFSGETKVRLADGRAISFRQLVREYQQGRQNYCYTVRDGKIEIAPILNPRKTKEQIQVIRIILDNKKEIICTPDHLFMLRDGSYKQAKDLTRDDSLFPFHRKISKKSDKGATIYGYEMIYQPNSHFWEFTHLLSDRFNLENGKYAKEEKSAIHHLDFNRLNNNPENLIRMDKDKHFYYHSDLAEKTILTEEIKEKAKKAHQKKEYKEKIKAIMNSQEMRKMLSERAKKQWQSEGYKQYMVFKFLEFYKKNQKYREKNKKILYENQKRYWSNPENRKRWAEEVRKYFQRHPEKRKEFSEKAKRQWQDNELLKWRSQKTKEQWTPEFKRKRKIAYNNTYFKHSIELMKKVIDDYGSLKKYDQKRTERRNNNLLKYSTFLKRFFGDNQEKLIQAVKNYNHKIIKIVHLKKKIDVYDLEVKGSHNFTLDAGVFVHNSGKSARDRKFQAILPLKGKILNVERARLDKMLSSEEIKCLIMALGCGIGEQFDISKLRYHRVILLADSDVDGQHITTLLLTFFYRHYRQLIDDGYLFIGQPPLYKIQAGKKIDYAYTESQKEEVLKTFPKDGGASIQRYKGLGEMNPEQLWETTLNPQNRILRKVRVEDAEQADAIFSMLMGEEVPPRKRFIQTHAKTVKNLDI